MRNISVAVLLAVFALLQGCKPKASATVSEWDQFQDPYFKVTFSYPKGWVVVKDTRKVSVFSSAETMDKFFDFDERKKDGVKIEIAAEKSDSMQDYVKYIQSYKDDRAAAGFTVKEIEQAKIDGQPAAMFTYSGNYNEATKVTAIRIATLKDSTIYSVEFAGLNAAFDQYRFVLDSVLATLVLPRPVIIPKGVDPSLPLEQTEKFSNAILELQYPANFSPSEMPKKGEVEFSMRLMGYRQDCTMDIDVRPAKKLTVEKVADQNVKIYKPTSRGTATLSGEKAIYFDYSVVKGVNSRVYFAVKNDKIYRVTMNYYTPMKSSFLPAFEKVVASIRVK